MAQKLEVHVYLAGPDVFFPHAVEIGEEKKSKLAAAGLHGHFPFDNEIPKEVFQDSTLAAHTIGKANEEMMLFCCSAGKIGVILVNMTPFLGPSMDVGTAFEAGFMGALATLRKNVIIIGYTSDPRLFEDRVIDFQGGRQNMIEREGRLFDKDGTMIEAFGQADNLMITQAIAKTGGKVVNSFDDAVQLAVKLSEEV